MICGILLIMSVAHVAARRPRIPWLRDGQFRVAWLLTLVAGIAIIKFWRVGPDWPAQEFRSWLVHTAGLQVWNNAWYGGHALPGYSVLYPVAAMLFGAGLSGVIGVTLSSWAAIRLTEDLDSRWPRAYGIVVPVGTAAWGLGNLIIGQVPFILGVAAALLAMLAVRNHRSIVAGVLAGVCSLFSPLAGLFLVLVAIAWGPEIRWRRAGPLFLAALGSAVSVVVGGGSGQFPTVRTSIITVSVCVVLGTLFISRDLRTLRRFMLVYGAAAAVLFTVPNPVGGNLTRLGQLIAFPLVLWLLARKGLRQWSSKFVNVVVVIGLLAMAGAWQVTPVVSAVARADGDPSRSAQFYSGLLSFLQTQNRAGGRLEIPFTREHWESVYVAQKFPIARGWERQLDLHYNAVLYHPLNAQQYRSWLAAAGVDLVALPRAPLDYGGIAERALLQRPPSYLEPVYSDRYWSVYRVVDASPLVVGDAADLVRLNSSSVTVNFTRPGTEVIRLHGSKLWRTGAANVCLSTTPDGWLQVRAFQPGVVTIRAQVTFANLFAAALPACDIDEG
jgi:hypothetical protein